jgi:hypothetical protein
MIDTKVFSLLVGSESSSSYLTIGGYDAEKYAKEEIKWHDIFGFGEWIIKADQVEIGG